MADKEPTSMEKARVDALAKLAELGGALAGEEDILFKGTKYVLPHGTTIRDGINFLEQRESDDENDVQFRRTYPYRPYDGARATRLAIEEFSGFTLGKTLYSFFGRQLPELISIKVGPGDQDTEQVPWGAMRIPGMKGMTIVLGHAKDAELGLVFSIVAEGPRKWRHHINGLFDLIGEKLKRHSIYKGRAIDGGENFIDVTSVDERDVVYTTSVQRRLEGDVWAFIRYEQVLADLGQDGKYCVLFEGPYGTGKSLAALLTAKIAVQHGWTFLMCRPGQDNLITTLELARMYQPAVVFAEDVDTMAGPQSGNTIERHLDMLDGIKVKGMKLLTVFTTNHPEDIHKAMLRPGRIGAVISIGAMDRDGIEKLGRRVIGESLDEDTNWDEVAVRCEGYMPAFVREVFDRAVRYAITLNAGVMGKIGTEAICLAADGLRDQYRLMEDAKEERAEVSLTSALGAVVQRALDGVGVSEVGEPSNLYYELTTGSNGS